MSTIPEIRWVVAKGGWISDLERRIGRRTAHATSTTGNYLCDRRGGGGAVVTTTSPHDICPTCMVKVGTILTMLHGVEIGDDDV